MASFHEDERAAQALAGHVLGDIPAIRPFMPDQHRTFFAGLRYLFVGAINGEGWPIATVASGPPGFVASPDPTRLSVAARLAEDDPAAPHLVAGRAVGLLGIDLSNRRRNRANGTVEGRDAAGFTVRIAESFGNCPKYIQVREAEPLARPPGRAEPLARLDPAARAAITAADTVFVGSRARAGLSGGADLSHRGGRPGFVAVEGDSLRVPDFSGNRFFNTFGNLLGEPRAALLVPDFGIGDLLVLQGEAEVDWTGRDAARFAGAERSWRFHVARGWRRPAALPFRWSPPQPAPQIAATGAWAD
ncbi:pyridoxamine 5'-phosphate oxidase family protein [Methylobacterium aerolatum]|uniref:Pyridoxine 5'-phosphate oxidase superfamily flavin-nucleotide-binding protein n=1 Tax=Methylobacterium aerolatum TaxID=418708 RepID=A0ABU0HVQ1_9HYPH|nr:pyridoxamine 5'-phosphate oxidase family protein [Methylobacterium aerolatum]MDQ0446419.1 putative pyridoxine 5'-phosphate oxidase superfamily flavin-nucleotide-binding protein [Methylobacterium aerolatum]GJD33418.1 hypothetical protein FMGBMHLM_0305 [Methylobacterium aerolatum]